MKFRQNTILDPKPAKLDQNSDFRHVRTFSGLHKLRNTQGKIHGTYLGNIYGIYKECITNISIDIYDITINIHKYIHQTHRRRLRRRPNGAPAEGGRTIGSVFLITLYHQYSWIFLKNSLHIPYIFHIYFLAMFHIFSLVCFLIYGVKSRSGHVQIPTFDPIWHVSNPEISLVGPCPGWGPVRVGAHMCPYGPIYGP